MTIGVLDTGQQIAEAGFWIGLVTAAITAANRWLPAVARAIGTIRTWVVDHFRDAVAEAVRTELNYRNDGNSFRDQVDNLEAAVAENATALETIEARLDVNDKAHEDTASSIRRLHTRIDAALATIAQK